MLGEAMAEEDGSSLRQVVAEEPKDFPPANFPTLFADGVLSMTHGRGVVKFYFHRIDPEMFARGANNTLPIAQVVMPAIGFAQMAAFFRRRIEMMIRDGTISEEQERAISGSEPPPDAG